MKIKTLLLLLLVLLTAAVNLNAQETEPTKTVEKTEKTEETKTTETKDAPKDTTKNNKDDDDATNQTTQQFYVRPDSRTRFKRYVNDMFGPVALAGDAAAAGFSTAFNSPEEWERTGAGFGRRFASNVGESVIKNTVIYGLDESFKLDSRFYRSRKKDFGSRLKNALISPFTARNASGKRVFGFPRIVGAYTSNIVANEVWYPSRFDYKDGLRDGTISFGTTALVNIFKEFVFK